MATIDECKKLAEYRAGKAGYNGYISPDDWNLLFPRAEQRYYNKLYAQYAATERISDSLSVFLSDPVPVSIASDGKYTIPAELMHVDSISHEYNGKMHPVQRVEKDRLSNHLSSQYDAPDEQFPIYTRFSSYLQFYPKLLVSVSIVYLKKLEPSKWAYTLAGTAGRERPVYTESGSVQPKWLDTDIDNIIYMVLSDLGLNMSDQNLQQFAALKTQTEI